MSTIIEKIIVFCINADEMNGSKIKTVKHGQILAFGTYFPIWHREPILIMAEVAKNRKIHLDFISIPILSCVWNGCWVNQIFMFYLNPEIHLLFFFVVTGASHVRYVS